MIPKILYKIGLTACITLIISCFIHWTYYPDIHKAFTGFFSEQNQYGKPGMVIVPMAVIIFIFMLLPKLWAKRANLFLAALLLGYAIKTYILFTSSYNTFYPVRLVGIYLMILSVLAILLSVIFPYMKIKNENS